MKSEDADRHTGHYYDGHRVRARKQGAAKGKRHGRRWLRRTLGDLAWGLSDPDSLKRYLGLAPKDTQSKRKKGKRR